LGVKRIAAPGHRAVFWIRLRVKRHKPGKRLIVRWLVALAVVLIFAACGESASQPGSVDVFRDFAHAAAEQDGDRLWTLISERMKAQISREEFTAPAVLRRLRDDYAAVAAGSVVLDVELEEEVSLVALEGEGSGPGARAAILRLEEGDWRVQLTELDLGYGGDLEFGVNARREDRASIETRAWIDRREAVVRGAQGSFEPTFRITPGRKLAGGSHSVVVYVQAGERSGTIAWTFER
jgi:hypothetical protein